MVLLINPMKQEIKIVLIWLVLVLVLRLSFFFPHSSSILNISVINVGLQLLLFFLSVLIAKNSKGSQRYIFLNCSLFFGFVIPMFLCNFVGTNGMLFPNSLYASLLSNLYVNKFGFNFFLVFMVGFFAIDYFFTNTKTITKYAITTGCTLLIVGIFFLPYFIQPFRLYDAEEFVKLRRLEIALATLDSTLRREPHHDELVNGVAEATIVDRVPLPAISNTEAQELVKTFSHYLKPNGNVTIFWKPIEQISMYIRCIALSIIVAVLFFFYKQNKPLGAYVDKILLLMVLFCSLEMLHCYGSMESGSYEEYKKLFEVGQYITVMNLLLFVYAFDLKRRFVCSVTGKYYERIIQESPEKITRWRDELDTYILKSFLTKHHLTKQLGLFSRLKKHNIQG